ncbi:Uncharacterized conserved protein, DUF58 family, contains vWF domain [Marinobacter daqiaonensis]|uniref:Uncharacterized conserved protein, DUF58 family, contains vWF domain n=1 Tax=Marinobacter daqiaonensis TaxID=650891 RepID=A0A1I6GWJ9_9GAMM|nr:DUF58 domain-containing protein [Marinobacter daqiaonensis]SFR46595.1 Uncharacterized conserved protein, DUF58 family, contains vWF domain [Marinobacter daqiaonensis]
MIPYNRINHVMARRAREVPLHPIKHKARQHWRRWLNRRIARTDSRRLDRKTIFILPTGAGAVFALLLLVMLITGINYQNSLIYLLTFLLGALFVAAMHQTHNNLSGLELAFLKPGDGFAGDPIPFRVRLQADHEAPAIVLFSGQTPGLTLSVPREELTDGTLLVTSRERGYLLPERVRVETRFPFGLLKAWSWLRPATPAVVFPRPLTPPHPAEGVSAADASEGTRPGQGQDQVELRPWREGDISARVDWKRFSRNGDMVVADWQGEQGSPRWLDYDGFPGIDQELRLSYLTALVLERDRAGDIFGLRLPGAVIAPDQGAGHRQQCLRALGTWGRTPPDEEPPHGC